MTLPVAVPVLHEPPATIRVRGVLAVVAGGGESVRVYERFGRRLAFDGYLVGVFESVDAVDGIAWLTAQQHTPRVVVGSDRGAAAALDLVAADPPAAGPTPDTDSAVHGMIVAGIPIAGVDNGSADAGQRTACPVHLGLLGSADAHTAASPGEVAVPDTAVLASLAVPVLAVHGGADAIAPLDAARAALSAIPTLEFVETVGGLHDALNDLSHRSVAATVVLWLERLRTGDVAPPIVREVTT